MLYFKTNTFFLLSAILVMIILTGAFKNVFAGEQEYIFDRVKTETGLSQSVVTCMLQDKKGFIWFGTQDGLNRYDGYNFCVYKNIRDNANSLINNSITCLLQCANHKLYVGTSSGLCSYDIYSRKWETITNKQFTTDLAIKTLKLDNNENIWIGTTENGLFVYNIKNNNIEKIDFKTANGELLHPEITSIYCNSADTIWVGTQGGLFYVLPYQKILEKVKIPFQPEMAFNMIMDICGNGKDKLWILVFERFVLEYNFVFKTLRKIEAPLNVETGKLNFGNCLFFDQDQILWLGMSRGVFCYNPVKNEWFEPRNLDRLAVLHEKNAISLLIDNRHSVWVSCWGEMFRLDTPTKKFLNPSYWLGKNDLTKGLIISCFTEDDKNNIWIGTDDKGLIYWDKGKNTMKKYEPANKTNRLISNNIMCLHFDKNGTLWIGTWSGINYLEKGRKNLGTIANTYENLSLLPDNVIRYIYEDVNNIIWVATNVGLASIDPVGKKTIKIYRSDASNQNSLVNNRVNHINQDKNGILWFACEAGISSFDPLKNKWTNYFCDNKANKLFSNSFYQIHFLDKNTLFLNTKGSGVVIFDIKTGGTRVFGEKDGMKNQNAYCTLFDKNRNAWLGTNKGISVFNLQDNTFQNFDSKDGLVSDEFNNNSIYQTADGTFYFGTIGGISLCKPEEIQIDTSTAPIILNAIKILNKEAIFASETFCLKRLDIDYTQKIISLEWAGLNFIHSQECKYQYKLEGFDADWVNSGFSRSATYTNLSPGNYSLKIKNANADGVWNSNYFSFPITVTAPFWMKTWFQMIMLVFFFLLVIFFIYIRLLIIRRRNIELESKVAERTENLKISNQKLADEIHLKNKFFHIIAHDLKSPLFGLIEMVKIVGNNTEIKSSPNLNQQINILSQSLSSISGLTDRLLQWAAVMTGKIKYQPEALLLNSIINCTIDELNPAAIKKQLQIEFNTNDDLIAFADENMVMTIFRNLLSNAIKFSFPNDRIIINTELNSSQVLVSIVNFGPLIPPDICNELFNPNTVRIEAGTQNEKGTGLGLQICHEFIRQNQGEIGVTSNVTSGTTFWFTLPLM